MNAMIKNSGRRLMTFKHLRLTQVDSCPPAPRPCRSHSLSENFRPARLMPVAFLAQTINCSSAIRIVRTLVAAGFILGVSSSGRAQNWVLTLANTNYNWQGIACSTNGSKVVAVAYDDGSGNPGAICTSTNLGNDWTQTAAPTNQGWQSVACSANGSNLMAVINNQYLNGNPGPIYISTNLGKTWKATASPNYWISAASSANGAKLAAADSGMGDGLIYTSADSGNNWTSNGPSGEAWASIASSTNGLKLAAADSGYGDGMIYVSTNSGNTWNPTTAPAFQWACIASSADGTRLVAANSGFGDDLIYVSTNSGNTWNPTPSPANQWSCVASSADGTKLVAADSGSGDGLIYISTNGGNSWTPSGPVGFWNSVASSADGSILTAASYPGGGIYLLQLTPSLNLNRAGTNLLLFWPNLSSGTGLVLQQNSKLNTTNWTTVSTAPGLTNGLFQLVVPLTLNTNRFYRLAGP